MYISIIDWGQWAVLRPCDANEERRAGVTCSGRTQYSVTLQCSSITYNPG